MIEQAPVDSILVTQAIAEIAALTETQYRDAMADNLLDEEPAETAAFRSPEMIDRSRFAARALLDSANAFIQRESGESNKSHIKRTLKFRNLVGAERRILEQIRAGHLAERGILTKAPNPRGRAARELQRLHPVEFLDLVRKHEESIREENRANRATQKEARAAERKAEFAASRLAGGRAPESRTA